MESSEEEAGESRRLEAFLRLGRAPEWKLRRLALEVAGRGGGEEELPPERRLRPEGCDIEDAEEELVLEEERTSAGVLTSALADPTLEPIGRIPSLSVSSPGGA